MGKTSWGALCLLFACWAQGAPTLMVATDVWREVPWLLRPVIKWWMISAEEGAQTTIHCATSEAAAGDTGLYYDKCRPISPSRAGRDPALAAELWRRSEDWLA